MIRRHHLQTPAVMLITLMLLLLAPRHGTPASPIVDGALTPFNPSNALDLSTYCTVPHAPDATNCITAWLDDARAQGKHLYVSRADTYRYARAWPLWNGVHLKCASTDVVFQNRNNQSNLFVIATSWSSGPEPYQDISVENCGFDLNGVALNNVSVLSINAGTAPARYITVRDNEMYDSTQPGSMYQERNRQRAYIVLTYVEDVLVENNQLSEGGRIKVGQPGRRVVIRNNTLININENAISIPDRGEMVNEDFLIENNTIINPLGSGIFFGMDGQHMGGPEATFNGVTIRNNIITGYITTNCITGTLPNNAARIYIYNNTCRKTTSRTPELPYINGIAISRNNTSTLPAQDITIENNQIISDQQGYFGTGIYFSYPFRNVCLIDNQILKTNEAIVIMGDTTGKMTGNDLGGGTLDLRSGVTMDQSGNIAGCL